MTEVYSEDTEKAMAEGDLPQEEPRQPLSEARSLSQNRWNIPDGDPLYETGIMAAVRMPREGRDSTDRQDASQTTAEVRAVPADEAARDALASRSVLIIEDTDELAEILQVTLQRLKMKTYWERSGEAAVERFKALQPDLILLDLGLPDLPGWKVLELVKEYQREHNNPPPNVIVVTAFGDPANRVVGKLQGVHSYLVKPFLTEEIERAVRSVFNAKV